MSLKDDPQWLVRPVFRGMLKRDIRMRTGQVLNTASASRFLTISNVSLWPGKKRILEVWSKVVTDTSSTTISSEDDIQVADTF
jgi:hypothetical protein